MLKSPTGYEKKKIRESRLEYDHGTAQHNSHHADGKSVVFEGCGCSDVVVIGAHITPYSRLPRQGCTILTAALDVSWSGGKRRCF